MMYIVYFFFQAEDGIRDGHVTGVQTCALPISPELRAKIFFVLGLLAIYRLGVFIPTPGFDYTNVMICSDQAMTGEGGNVLGMVNMFSGGALMQLSVFSLGVMPYITASIIMQLLRVVIPRFEDLHKEGQAGTAKLTQYTRY